MVVQFFSPKSHHFHQAWNLSQNINSARNNKWIILLFSTWSKLGILPEEKEGTSTPGTLSLEKILMEEFSSVSTEEDNFRLTPAVDASNLKSSIEVGKKKMENIIAFRSAHKIASKYLGKNYLVLKISNHGREYCLDNITSHMTQSAFVYQQLFHHLHKWQIRLFPVINNSCMNVIDILYIFKLHNN